MKAVIVYYSLEGNTKYVVDTIANTINADVIELKPKKVIPNSGFKKFLWGGKSVIFKEKPELLNGKIDLSTYDTVILGTPIWAGTFAPPLRTFLSECSIQGKQIFLFACHAGGGGDKCFENIKTLIPGNTIKGVADFVNPLSAENQAKDKIQAFCNTIKTDL